jgi:hypothetical protein
MERSAKRTSFSIRTLEAIPNNDERQTNRARRVHRHADDISENARLSSSRGVQNPQQ